MIQEKKKLEKYYNKIDSIREDLDNLIGKLEEKQNAIEQKAIDKDRDMTETEQEKYDSIELQIRDIRECIDNLEYALDSIREYC